MMTVRVVSQMRTFLRQIMMVSCSCIEFFMLASLSPMTVSFSSLISFSPSESTSAPG